MSVQISTTPALTHLIVSGDEQLELTFEESLEVLETLARILDYSLVDHVERQGLLELATEIYDDPNEYPSSARAWAAWQHRAEVLADAVTGALRTGEAVV